MTAQELLAKATVIFRSYIKTAIRNQQLVFHLPNQKRVQTFPQKAWIQFEFSSLVH
jgi:hypothetical protein